MRRFSVLDFSSYDINQIMFMVFAPSTSMQRWSLVVCVNHVLPSCWYYCLNLFFGKALRWRAVQLMSCLIKVDSIRIRKFKIILIYFPTMKPFYINLILKQYLACFKLNQRPTLPLSAFFDRQLISYGWYKAVPTLAYREDIFKIFSENGDCVLQDNAICILDGRTWCAVSIIRYILSYR